MTQQEHENEKVNHLAIALGLLAGLVFGLTAAVTGSEPLIRIATAFRPVGTAFVNAIQMVVIPLVMVVVFLGAFGMKWALHLFSAATIPMAPDATKGLFEVGETVENALIRMVHWILWTAPLGVFALGRTGPGGSREQDRG